jgi:two-component system, NarL family, sensor histidine kinase UhpB
LIALCSRVSRQTGMPVQRDLSGQLPALAGDVELVIYRVAQEALTNAIRHADASEITVSLASTDGLVVLAVRDDGRGLPDATNESGLAGMRERAMLIGAELDVDSGARRGTEIILRVPVPHERS